MRAAIDCGTNSFRLLIVDDAGNPIAQRLIITRLGQGVHETRRLDPAAMHRSVTALSTFREIINEHAVSDVRAVATSAARDAHNGAEFLEHALAALGTPLTILSGDEEAALTFAGAVNGMGLTGPVLVVDIGGGSTELAYGNAGSFDHGTSLDIGCVRLTELALHADPYTEAERNAARSMAAELIATFDWSRVSAGTTLVGVAGSTTSLAVLARGLEAYTPDCVHDVDMTHDAVRRLSSSLAAMTNAQRLQLPALPPGRADVITAGAVILDEVMTAGRFDRCTVSERDLLWSLATQD